MATRSRKSTVTTSMDSPRACTSTTPGTPIRSKVSHRSSPLSPIRISRLQEKADLQNLNDRLAAYIDRVRHLELENNRLNVQVETIQESVHKEIVSMKGSYEQELGDARKLLDDTARDKAQLQIDVGKLKADNEDILSKLLRRERDLNVSENALTGSESQLADLQKRANALDAEKKKNLQELRDLRDENGKIQRQLNEAKTQLETETLHRVDLENRCQSLKEEMQFKQQMYEKEVTETKTKRSTEVSEIDGRLQEEYDSKLHDALRELRSQYEEQMAHNRGEVQSIYEARIEDLNYRLSRNTDDTDGIHEQLKDARTRTEELLSRNSYLENSHNSLQQRVKDLEAQLASDNDLHRNEVANLKDEIQNLREQMTEQLQEYQDLMDTKLALDMEIAAYRKLLESEESRLNLSSMEAGLKSSSVRRTPMKGGGTKRKRDLVEEETTQSAFQATATASGEVHIVEECPEGNWIKMENKGNKDISLGGFHLTRKANGVEVVYKFHRAIKFPGESTVTVWSADTDTVHDSPHTLVMKQKWPIGETIATTLLNSDGEEIATRESKKESRSSSIHYGSYRGGAQQQLPPQRAGTQAENCSVM